MSACCLVCGAESTASHLNYGSESSCLSCRAFFRRALEANVRFACKSNDDLCLVTVNTRRRCQKCRFAGCLRAGMRPELVMTLGAKQRRFRRSYMWNEQRLSFKGRNKTSDEDFQGRWEEAVRKTEAEDSVDIMLPLVWFHLGEDFAFSKEELDGYLTRVAKTFFTFSFQMECFSDISKSRQREMLMEKSPLFVQYVFARYLTASDGQEQLQWLGLKPAMNTNGMNLEKVSLNRLDESLCLFQDDVKKRRYEEQLARFSDCEWPLGQIANDILCHHRPQFEALIIMQENSPFVLTPKMLPFPKIEFAQDDFWIFHRIDDFIEAYFSLPIPSDIIAELKAFNATSSLIDASSFAAMSVNIYFERFLRVLKNQPEFSSLNDTARADAWIGGREAAFGLTVARNDSLGKASAAVKKAEVLFGEECGLVDTRSLNAALNVLDEGRLLRFEALASMLGSLVAAETDFALLTLILLTENCLAMSHLHRRFSCCWTKLKGDNLASIRGCVEELTTLLALFS